MSMQQMTRLQAAFRDRDPEDDGLTLAEFVEFLSEIVTDDTHTELRALFLKVNTGLILQGSPE